MTALHGTTPGGSGRNGLPFESVYEYRGKRGWNPAAGVHLDPSVVGGKREAPESASRSRSEKQEEYFEARDVEFTLAEAAEIVGVAVSTALKYERAYRVYRDAQTAGAQ